MVAVFRLKPVLQTKFAIRRNNFAVRNGKFVTLHSSVRGCVNYRGQATFFAANRFSGKFPASCHEKRGLTPSSRAMIPQTSEGLRKLLSAALRIFPRLTCSRLPVELGVACSQRHGGCGCGLSIPVSP